ncbi:hypothetical protein JVT61DRAFT_8658 [Boletus reticuloceps]|uniref:Uncharacterized protein n=1 Tax=Boletus reticuloceps TaxID=495285 RepID=A0A8I2YXG4_9AGAM|nr:hypothetical protein JVT61DRAFT_8658 [Boletus reticuloceps]
MSLPFPTWDIEDDSEAEQVFSISLTVYTKVKKTLRGKTTSKEEKLMKTKELVFAVKPSNYVDFLQSILQKHGQDDYEVKARKHYPFRYTLPNMKGQRTVDAIDVDNVADYQEMVIKKLPRAWASSNSGRNDSDSEGPSGGGDKAKSHSAKTEHDNHLGLWRLRLQKKHKNKHNDGMTYIGPFGALSLTQPMILDWAHAIEEGHATLDTPPNIDSFNTANKAPILHARRAQAQLLPPVPAPVPAIDVNSLTSVLLIQTLAQSGLLGLTANTVTPVNPSMSIHVPVPLSTPQTPTWQRNHSDATLSPQLVPSLSHLMRYLEYAEVHLGVRHALTYKTSCNSMGLARTFFQMSTTSSSLISAFLWGM